MLLKKRKKEKVIEEPKEFKIDPNAQKLIDEAVEKALASIEEDQMG